MSFFLSFRGNNNNNTQDAAIALEPLTTHPEEWAELEESEHTVHKHTPEEHTVEEHTLEEYQCLSHLPDTTHPIHQRHPAVPEAQSQTVTVQC